MIGVLSSFLFIGFLSVCGQNVKSPCPDLFDYRQDETGVYGIIHLEPFGPVSTVKIMANFTISAFLPSTYAGSIQPVGSELILLQEFNRGVPLQYRVNFPITSPLPKLTSLTVNHNILCYGPGDTVENNRYIATIMLQHTLFFKSGPNGLSDTPYIHQPQVHRKPEVHYINKVPPPNTLNRDQTFTYIQNVDEDSWNQSGFSGINESQPSYETPTQPIHVHRPSVPEYVHYPERTTKSAPTRTTSPPTTRTTTAYTTESSRPVIREPPTSPVKSQGSSGECGVNGNHEEGVVPLIYQGFNYERGEWPWLVAIYKKRYSSLSYICAGTLVSERHVVTAAHCMQRKSSYTTVKNLVVKAGVYNLDDWGDDVTITRSLVDASIHEAYNTSTFANDILVLTMEKPVPYNSNIKPACLWRGNPELNRIVGTSGVVAGWGASEIGPAGKGEPRMVRVPVVSTATCRASKPEFHRLTSSKTLCAGDRNGAGPCLGDSGGGLYILDNGRWRLRGVVSISLWSDGDNTCNLNDYVVFTDTAQYLPWISKVMSNSIEN